MDGQDDKQERNYLDMTFRGEFHAMYNLSKAVKDFNKKYINGHQIQSQKQEDGTDVSVERYFVPVHVYHLKVPVGGFQYVIEQAPTDTYYEYEFIYKSDATSLGRVRFYIDPEISGFRQYQNDIKNIIRTHAEMCEDFRIKDYTGVETLIDELNGMKNRYMKIDI